MARRDRRRHTQQPLVAPVVSVGEPVCELVKEATPERFNVSFCILGIVMIVVGTCLTFQWMAAPGETKFLGSWDTWMYYGPILSFMDHCLHRGELPQWNPLYFCGQPFAANPQSFLFYPPNLLRSLLTFNPTPLRTHTGIAVMVLLQFLMGGMSVFFLARRHALSYGAALVAAFAFVFSAPLVTRVPEHWIFLNCVCWLPLALLLLNHAMSRKPFRQRTAFAVAASLSWGMTILGGVPVLIMLCGLTMGLYGLLFRLLYPFRLGSELGSSEASHHSVPSRKEGARKQKSAPSFLTGRKVVYARRFLGAVAGDAVILALVVIGGILIAAPLLLPGVEFSGHTARAVKSADAQEDLAHVEAGWDFLRMLVVYQGHGHYEGIRSSGAIAFMLALIAFARKPKRDVVLFGGILLILLDCSLSKPLFFGRILNAAAPFAMSNPGRAMVVACLPLGMLAGFGTDVVLESLASLRGRIARSLVVGAAGLLVVLVVALAHRPEPVLQVGLPVILLPALACVVALAAGWFPEPILWGTMLSMLVLGETLAWNRALIPSLVPPEARYPQPMENLARPAHFWSDNCRGGDLQPNVKMYGLEAVMNGYDPMQLREVSEVLCTTPKNKAFRRVVSAAEATALNYRGNLFLKRQLWLARQYVDGPLPEKNELFPAASTVFLRHADSVPVPAVARAAVMKRSVSKDATVISLLSRNEPPTVIVPKDVATGDRMIQTRELNVPPLQSSLMLTVTGNGTMTLLPMFNDPKNHHVEAGACLTLQFKDGKELLCEIPMPDMENVQVMLKPDFKGGDGQFRLLEAKIVSDHDDENDRIHILSRSANRLDVEVTDLPDARILLNVDSFYPGWQASVDGQPAPILRANDVFKAVVVPKGTHTVRFEYHSRRVWAGLAVSGMYLAFAGVVTAWSVAGSRRIRPVQA